MYIALNDPQGPYILYNVCISLFMIDSIRFISRCGILTQSPWLQCYHCELEAKSVQPPMFKDSCMHPIKEKTKIQQKIRTKT